MEEMQESASAQALELALGSAPSLVAKAACELGIPDMLAEAGQPLSARKIAEKLQEIAAQRPDSATASDSQILAQERVANRAELVERMMRFLSTRGVFMAAEGGTYALTPLSVGLVQRGNPTSLQSILLFENSQEMLAPWHHLAETILAGNLDHVAPFSRVHGTDVWGLASANTPFSHLLNAAMSSCSHISLQAFLAHYEGLEQVRTLVDVGGGTGTSASYIAARYPFIKVFNFDLPHVVASAPVYPGVEHIGGDMFEAIPPCDSIFMKWVLHDWSDGDCIKILKNCYKALPAHGKVIIMDAVLEDGDKKKGAFNNLRVTLDMVMMAHTTHGKERTGEQWECILHASNFCDIKFYDVPSPQCIIEALPCSGM